MVNMDELQRIEALVALKLEQLLAEKENADSSEQLAFVKERYSWETVVKETLQVYREVIGRKRKK